MVHVCPDHQGGVAMHVHPLRSEGHRLGHLYLHSEQIRLGMALVEWLPTSSSQPSPHFAKWQLPHLRHSTSQADLHGVDRLS